MKKLKKQTKKQKEQKKKILNTETMKKRKKKKKQTKPNQTKNKLKSTSIFNILHLKFSVLLSMKLGEMGNEMNLLTRSSDSSIQ